MQKLRILGEGGNYRTKRLEVSRQAPSDFRNYTLLHVAARANNVAVARVLLKYGADINAKSVADWTPLHVAACFDRLDMVNFLIEAGANPNALSDPRSNKVKVGETPYEIGVERGHEDLARILYGKTSFFHRLSFESGAVILLLIIVGLLMVFAMERRRVLRKRKATRK